jgi:acetyl-CoA acetyltransferase
VIAERVGGYAQIVGIGATSMGEHPGRSGDELAIEAIARALSDAHVSKSDVDGLITCKGFAGSGIDVNVGRMMGINPAYSATLDYGTCNFSLHLACMAIASGLARAIVLTYGTNQRTAGNTFSTPVGGAESRYYATEGFLNIAGPAAMAFRRHQHLYGTTQEQLGRIAVNQRSNARLNPEAIFRDELSIEDYLHSRYIVAPLRRPDLTMISDGGAALVVTTPDRARDLPVVPVSVLGISQHTGLRDLENPDHLMRPWIGEVASRIYDNAGIRREDVDVLYIQDPTSVWVLQMLEWFGFCGVGEAGPFLEEGHTALAGRIPVNTHGGQLSESYMWGWMHLVEAVRQLRGEAGARQVRGAEIAQYCSTMAFKKAASSVLVRGSS